MNDMYVEIPLLKYTLISTEKNAAHSLHFDKKSTDV